MGNCYYKYYLFFSFLSFTGMGGSHHTVQADLRLTVILLVSLPPECWDYTLGRI